MEPKEQRKVDDFIIYAMAAATQALTDAGWKPTAYEDQIRTGVLIGSGIGGLQGIEKTSLLLRREGPAPGEPVLHSRPPDQSRRPAMSRSSMGSKVRTMPWSPPARPARMPSAMPRGWSRSAMPT